MSRVLHDYVERGRKIPFVVRGLRVDAASRSDALLGLMGLLSHAD